MGSGSYRGKGQSLGVVPARWKALGVSAAVYAAEGIIPSSIMACSERDHLVVNNGTTCDAAFCQNSLTTCWTSLLSILHLILVVIVICRYGCCEVCCNSRRGRHGVHVFTVLHRHGLLLQRAMLRSVLKRFLDWLTTVFSVLMSLPKVSYRF